MADDLNSVKSARTYHHGALRAALLAAAAELIAERGVDRFSLRETARRAGVSPAAPAHHFGDARGLLTALAADGFTKFGDALAQADAGGGSREERIRRQGMAYVGFAIAERARFDLMWRYALIDRADPAYREAAARAFAMLDAAVRGGPAQPGARDAQAAASVACWSMVHGFARLALDGAFGEGEEAMRRAAGEILPAVLDHLEV